MDLEVEESLSIKRRKTDNSERDTSMENTLSEEDAVSEDQDSFLREFLNKRPQSNLTLFQKVIIREEIEAKERDSAEDLKLYRDACADFSDCVTEIAEIKASKPEGWKEQVNEIRKDAAFTTLIMKKLNRVEKTRTKISREKISKERQKADVAKIKLDNMLCEMQHLRKEIDKCLKFRSRPLGIDLISVDEFYEKAPKNISKPEITKNDEHQLQLARLEWELKQRKELATLLSDLESKKTLFTEQIDKKERDLNSLAPLIKDVLSVTQPLKEKLGPITSKTTTIGDRAAFLPDPLYFLFVHASAYSDACDKDISLDVKGDFAEARRCKNQTNNSTPLDNAVGDPKENSSKKSLELEQKMLLAMHPLSVQLKLAIKDGCVLELAFFYMKNLHIMTVKPTLCVPLDSKTPFTDVVVHSRNLLHNLFSGDTGQESPNIVNYYQLLQVSLEALDISSYGFPYIWVQKIGGLNFCALNRKVEPKQDVARTSLPVIIKELKRRCLYRLSLLSLVEGLEQGNIIAPKNMKSLKPVCQLKFLKGISWADYSEDPLSDRLKSLCYVSESDIHFKAVIIRNAAELTCLVTVKADYPLSPCVFALQWDGVSDSRQRKSFCLDMEREVNLNWKELLTSRTEATFLLSYQLFKTMLCFDIVLESVDPQQYSPSKALTTSFRGRNRVLPFKYVPEENTFVHRI